MVGQKITRGQQFRIADHLDQIANERLRGSDNERLWGHSHPNIETVVAERLLLGAAYRAVAADLRACANEDGTLEYG